MKKLARSLKERIDSMVLYGVWDHQCGGRESNSMLAERRVSPAFRDFDPPQFTLDCMTSRR